jgi:predicted GNAT family acetyltransferase
MSKSTVTITHRPELNTFEAIVEGHRCVADYRRDGQLIRMTHTFVHPALEGRGIAAQLVQAALQWVRHEGLKVDPVCSYVALYVRRNAEWQDLLAR